MPTPAGKTKLNTDIAVDLKQEFKVHCVVNGFSMTDIVEDLIRTYLANFKKEKGAV